MKTEKEIYDEVKSLMVIGLQSEAIRLLEEFTEYLNVKPNYAVHYWRAESYLLIDPQKYIQAIQEDVSSCEKYINDFPNKTFPNLLLILKAKVMYHLGNFADGIEFCDMAIKTKIDSEAYRVKAILFAKLGNEDAAWTNMTEAAKLGNTKAIETISKRR